jgi:hypothetical protein
MTNDDRVVNNFFVYPKPPSISGKEALQPLSFKFYELGFGS